MTNNGEVLRWAGIEGKGGQTCIAPACYIRASFPSLMNSRLPCLSWKTRNHAHAISFSIDVMMIVVFIKDGSMGTDSPATFPVIS